MEKSMFVVCEICGKRMRQISTGHVSTHNITMKDYRKSFPEAEMMCLDMKDKISKRTKGRKISEDMKKRISRTMKKRYAEIEDFPLKIQNKNQEGENNLFFGRKHTKETREVISKKTSKWLKKAYKENRRISPFSYLGNGKEMSQFELEVYRALKPIGYKAELSIPFPKGCYKIDFAEENKKIAIELDSSLHDEKKIKERDERKDSFLRERGWKVIRIKFNAARDNPIDLAERVLKKVKEVNNEDKANKSYRKISRTR